MNLGTAVAVFPVIFLGELPDKTMFASLVLSTKGRPAQVWLGAAAAFVVHVAIATTIGVGLFQILPTRAVDGVVTALFLAGAGYAWWESINEEEVIEREAKAHAVVTTAFVVIFLAEWGDLTQILTANLAARYHDVVSVGVGAVAALWVVAVIAVVSGQGLLRWLNIRTIRRITAAVLVCLAIYTGYGAISG